MEILRIEMILRPVSYTHLLLQVDVNAGYSNIVIDKAIKEANLDQRDASLAAAIFYGVLERRITLDYIINQFSRICLLYTSFRTRYKKRQSNYTNVYAGQSCPCTLSLIHISVGNNNLTASYRVQK